MHQSYQSMHVKHSFKTKNQTSFRVKVNMTKNTLKRALHGLRGKPSDDLLAKLKIPLGIVYHKRFNTKFS